MVIIQRLYTVEDVERLSIDIKHYITESGNKVRIIWGEEATMEACYHL